MRELVICMPSYFKFVNLLYATFFVRTLSLLFPVFKTRKVGDEQQRHLHYHSPSIPLTIPTHPYNSPEESIAIKNLSRHNQIKTTPRILHQYEWYKENIMLQQSYGLKRSLDSLTWDSVKWSFEKYLKELSMHRLLPSHSDSIVYDKVEDAYSDIPIPLLQSYMDESCLQDYLSEDYFNIRNCITRWKDNLVIYASGPYCNEVVLVKLVFLEDGLIDTRVFATENVHSRIFELQCYGDMLFVRTCYTVAYYCLVRECFSGGHSISKGLNVCTSDPIQDCFQKTWPLHQ